jgi:hypothetical protein
MLRYLFNNRGYLWGIHPILMMPGVIGVFACLLTWNHWVCQ